MRPKNPVGVKWGSEGPKEEETLDFTRVSLVVATGLEFGPKRKYLQNMYNSM